MESSPMVELGFDLLMQDLAFDVGDNLHLEGGGVKSDDQVGVRDTVAASCSRGLACWRKYSWSG
jgi:hypothetical protein